MNLQDAPIGMQVTIIHRFLVAEDQGYWCWETEEVTGTVHKHPNETITLLWSGMRLISCRNDKDKIIN